MFSSFWFILFLWFCIPIIWHQVKLLWSSVLYYICGLVSLQGCHHVTWKTKAKEREYWKQCIEESKASFGLQWALRVLGIKSETIHVVILFYRSYQLRCSFYTQPHRCANRKCGIIWTTNIIILTVNTILIQNLSIQSAASRKGHDRHTAPTWLGETRLTENIVSVSVTRQSSPGHTFTGPKWVTVFLLHICTVL
jgi:hypothetical protein